MGLLALISRKEVQPRGFAQLELIWIFGSAGTEQPLPFRGTRNILNVRSVAVDQFELFDEVMCAAIWTLDVKARFGT